MISLQSKSSERARKKKKDPSSEDLGSGKVAKSGLFPDDVRMRLTVTWALPVAQMVKNPPAMRETWIQSLGWEDPLEEGIATPSSILAWRIHMDRRAWWLQSSSSSVTQFCPTLCDPMNCSTPGLLVHHQLPESTQTHVHLVCDAIQPSHPLLSFSPPALSPSQHQGLFK